MKVNEERYLQNA